jgi:hypothetical protein
MDRLADHRRLGTYRAAYRQSMSVAALTGSSGGGALFHRVLPRAASLDPVARAARAVEVPAGSLPNGSGMAFGPPGGPDAGANLRAADVIWEWTAPGRRQVTWPSPFAAAPIAAIPLAR